MYGKLPEVCFRGYLSNLFEEFLHYFNKVFSSFILIKSRIKSCNNKNEKPEENLDIVYGRIFKEIFKLCTALQL